MLESCIMRKEAITYATTKLTHLLSAIVKMEHKGGSQRMLQYAKRHSSD